MLGENQVEPVQQIDLIRGPRSELIIEAAVRDPEQPALPVDGQPRLLPIIARLSTGGLPSQKITFDLQLADLAVQIVDDLLCIVNRQRVVATREQLARFIRSPASRCRSSSDGPQTPTTVTPGSSPPIAPLSRGAP
jgi:hypothetical protein